MIDPHFVYLAAALSLLGAYGYIRDTLRGVTSPNRLTWSLWGVEGVLAFFVEIQQHVGLASLMTLMLGLVPCAVVVASFRNRNAVWKLGAFDAVCGAVSVAGLVFWALINEPTVALVSFVAADQMAALPTVRKSWLAPSTESPRLFFLGSANCAITVLTLTKVTTAGALFPGCILITDLIMGLLIVSNVGPRLRGGSYGATKPKMA
ncbi:MAG: hypothetical protein WCF25_05740 [Acidimicrobiales bacterium]